MIMVNPAITGHSIEAFSTTYDERSINPTLQRKDVKRHTQIVVGFTDAKTQAQMSVILYGNVAACMQLAIDEFK